MSDNNPAPPVAPEAPILEETSVEPPEERQPIGYAVPRAVAPLPVSTEARLKDFGLYFNQELSWLDFNWRVLHLALDERTPLLERVRFVAITASNLDEFMQKRVGGLRRQEAAGVRALSPDGRTPTEQLALIHDAVRVMHGTMTDAWERVLKERLRVEVGVEICDYSELDQTQREGLYDYFLREIYPILTPLTVDPGHPFPFISNLSLSLAILLRHPLQETKHFARVKMPLGRWIPLHEVLAADALQGVSRYLPVEQLVAHHVDELFPGMEILNVHPFRVTRNADLRRDEEEAEELIAMIAEELRERRFAPVVRLEVDEATPDEDVNLLTRELGLNAQDVYRVDGLIDLTACFRFADLNDRSLRFKPWEPVVPSRLQHEGETKDTRDVFAIIRQGDLLVHHPYESFTASVQRFVEEAAEDPRVLAIKQTLYRTSDESPIVKGLIRAAERGKQVAVLVEVKARFDEANNIEWGQMLENSGVHVTYGLVGLKTHTKATLIVRRERDGLRAYCHIGTGNYHPKTARLYTDLGLLTCDPALGRDVVNLFHYLTGYAPGQKYEKVLVAPRYMRHTFIRLVKQEMVNQEAYGNGRIIAKMNALDDIKVIRWLYKASRAGVQVDLIIRGHCRLRPGLPGFSENIRVISILGRFLEHDRIFYFYNDGEPLTYIGSADWRGRNLNSRVELITPIEEPELQARLVEILEAALEDNYRAWDLHPDGQYVLRRPGEEESTRSFHRDLMKKAVKRAKE